MIYVTGDVHRHIDEAKMKRLKKHVTPSDYIIIAGDFGIFWDEGKGDKEVVDFYSSFVCPVLWVDGNHENFNVIDKLPIEERYGAPAGIVSPNVIRLMRGEVYNIAGQSIFTFGGAESIDKHIRTPNLSWWEHEMPTAEEYEHAIETLQKYNYTVDYVITHDAPKSFYYEAYNKVYENDIMNFLEDEIKNKAKYKCWYFGHHHMDEVLDTNMVAVYNTIREIRV